MTITPPRPDAFPASQRPSSAPHVPRRDPVLWIVGAIGCVAVLAASTILARPPQLRTISAPPGVAGATPTPSGGPEDHMDPNGTYAFLGVTFWDGHWDPVRWNPCQPIEYQVDLEVTPPGADAAIDEAVAASSSATGIAFHDDGVTDVAAVELFKRGFVANPVWTVYRPVLITIVSHREFRKFKTPKRVIAFTRPKRGEGIFDGQWVAGAVVVDGGVRYASSGRWSLRLVLQHELGHLLGLNHVTAPDELMFSFEVAKSTIPDPIDGWGPGDIAGLQQLGADQGCLRHVRIAA
jgi:hypothetical protein